MKDINSFTEELRKEVESLVAELPEKNDYNSSFTAGFLSSRRITLSNIKNFFKKNK